MVTTENCAYNNECLPNNKLLCISFHFTGQREHKCHGDVAHGDTRSRVQLGKASYIRGHHVNKYILTSCLNQQFSLRTVRMWEMFTNYIILCSFGDNRCKVVGYILRINCSVVIAVSM